jgi:hypothetical protein
MADGYRFETHGRAEVTILSLEGVEARAGAKSTRYFRKLLTLGEDHALQVAREALRRLPEARTRWPTWSRPAGLQPHEQELILPAFLLADGRSVEQVDQIVADGGSGF